MIDDGVDVPVDLDRNDVLHPVEQPLVAQVAERQSLGRRAQRHQRDELVLVDVERERMLARDRRVANVAVLVDGAHGERGWPCGIGEERPVPKIGSRWASATDIAHLDLRLPHGFPGTDFRIAVGARSPYGGDGIGDRLVTGAPSRSSARRS